MRNCRITCRSKWSRLIPRGSQASSIVNVIRGARGVARCMLAGWWPRDADSGPTARRRDGLVGEIEMRAPHVEGSAPIRRRIGRNSIRNDESAPLTARSSISARRGAPRHAGTPSRPDSAGRDGRRSGRKRARSTSSASWTRSRLAGFGTPEEVDALVAYLTSDDTAYANGSYFVIDGGPMRIWQAAAIRARRLQGPPGA
jgi:hypothetical protein